MLNKDFVIQSDIRRILVRSNIEYSRIEFGTVRGVVYFWGVFKMGGPSNNAVSGGEESERKLTLETLRELVRRQQDLTIRTLYLLEKRVKGVPGVTDVVFQFLNWRKDKGQWIPIKEKKEKREERVKNEAAFHLSTHFE